MVLVSRNADFDEAMPQTVPSAGFTPPCDYSNFAENFDLSLLPGGEEQQSISKNNPKIYSTFYENFQASPELQLDFETELSPKLFFQQPQQQQQQQQQNYLEVPIQTPNYNRNLLSPTADQFGTYRQSSEAYFYPSSPELSLYTPSPTSVYSRSPRDDSSYINQTDDKKVGSPYYFYGIKEENLLSPEEFSSPTSPATSCSSLSSPEHKNIFQQQQQQTPTKDVLELLENTVLDKPIKEETTDFGDIFNNYPDNTKKQDHQLLREVLRTGFPETNIKKEEEQIPKDHQLLREFLRDTSFQKKYNIRTFDFDFDFKMKEPDENVQNTTDLMRENIEPVFNLAIEQMRKDVLSTCAALGISPDPLQWSPSNVFAWLQWTSRQFDLSEPIAEQWEMNGSSFATLTEEEFIKRQPQGGMILYAQLEIWKAAYSDDDLNKTWMTETTSSNASSGDISDDDDEETSSPQTDPNKPTTSRPGGSHIHLWQFLKELLTTPQTHGSCIRWLDRTKGIFKIEDSVKVARLWGKRKNRPAMNYDKLSRSIRQYYKKGIMKKTERSQRLVYQFCHPYNL